MGISNRFLAWLLVIAIVITVGGTVYSISTFNRITGYGTEGFVNITINSSAVLNVTATACNFGNGWVTAGQASATLASNGTLDNWDGAGTSDSLELTNDGNVNLVVNVTSGKTAATLIGGTSPQYRLWSNATIGSQGEAGSCITGNVTYPGTSMDTTELKMCANLSTTTASDEMAIGCYLVIPADAAAGAKGDILTFTIYAA